MKKLLLTLFAALTLQFAVAQYYIIPWTNAGMYPGGLNNDAEFPVGGGISAGWTTVLGGAPASPGWSANQNIPFTFSFNGAPVTSYKVSNSGVLTFTTSASAVPAYGSVALPNAAIPDNSVCILGLKPYGNNSNYANIVSKTFGASPNRQHWVTFSAYNDINIGITGYNFWAIVMEETTNNIYVVDQRSYGGTSKLAVGIQINSTTATSVTGSPNLAALAGTSSTPSDNSFYQFIQGTQPANDILGIKSTVADYLILGQAPFTISADIRNLGTAKMTSADFNYSVNGGATVTSTAIGAAANPLATVNVQGTTKWTPSAIGTYTITSWLSNINGGADGNTTNDKVTKTVTVVDNYAPRVILDEVFTSSTCPPCNPGNANFLAVTQAKDPKTFTVVKYQMNYPGTGDPYYTAECNARHSTFYGINSIPRMEVDGGWDGNANSYTSAIHDQFVAKPAFMEVTGTSSIHWKTVTINASVKPLMDVTSTSLYLFAALCEKQTVKNVKTNGETEFYHVMKKMIPTASGTLLTGLTKNTTTTKTLTWTVPGVYTLAPNGQSPINVNTQNSIEDLSNMEVVLWVQDINTKDVWQSGITTHTYSGIDNNQNNVETISVFPNPTNGLTKVNFALNNDNKVNVTIVNSLGQTVRTLPAQDFTAGFNSFEFDAAGLSSGVYFIQFQGDNFTTTQKFVVE
jgi:hypothetical protein